MNTQLARLLELYCEFCMEVASPTLSDREYTILYKRVLAQLDRVNDLLKENTDAD